MGMSQEDAMELLSSHAIQTGHESQRASFKDTAAKQYEKLLRPINVTSHSQLEIFHTCPRKFQKTKERSLLPGGGAVGSFISVDFAFGHAVGAGVQNYLVHGDTQLALFNCVMAWGAAFTDEIKKSKKSLWNAMIAVESFIANASELLLDEWELLYLPNGKPAIETSFSVHVPNGYKHYMHMDVGLRHRRSKKVAVLDVKTTGFNEPEEAIYGNSPQAPSYAIMLEHALGNELMSYDVFYLVYASSEREWHLLNFTKSALDQAEYIKDLVLTQDLISTYNNMRFFPKRGGSCFNFRRRCEFYGECNMTNEEPNPVMPEEEEAEVTDYVIELADVIETLKQRKQRSR